MATELPSAETAPPVNPPALEQIRSSISAKYSELNAEEARVAVAVEQETVLGGFERDAAPVITRVGSVPLDALQFISDRRDDEKYQQAVSSAQQHVEANAAIRRLEVAALDRVRGQNSDTAKRIRGMEAALRKKERAAHGKLKAAFGKVADTLATALTARKQDVIHNIGVTERARANFAMTEATQSANWSSTPQPLILTIRALRVVRDKVLRGRYSVHVRLYDRLGGKVLSAAASSAEERDQWKLDDKTGPKQHAGRPRDDAEIFFNQPLEFVLPSEQELQPAMCFVFELVMLKGRLQARDQVVAWGAFPVCDATFRYVQGEFKTTMLYGEVNPGMDKYYKVEQAISQDLDNWLCNLYFDVELAAREKDGGSTEYDQRLEYAQEVLRLTPLAEKDAPMALGDRQPAHGSTRHRSRGVVASADRAARAELHLEDYRFSVQPRESSRLLRLKKPLDQMEVVRRNLAAEVYATEWRTTSFLGQTMLILSAFILRHYLHYFGQLLYLEALGVPIIKFAIRESGIVLAYDTQQLHPYTEMAVTVVGMGSVWIAQLLFVSCAWVSMRGFGQFPDAYSMFLLAWCVVTFLDPFIILLSDIYHSNWSQGDAFKCRNAFLFSEGDGTVGIGITVFLVGIHCILTFCSSYLYLVNLHRNAQVQDILRRSEAQEGDFFVPEDDEISLPELEYLCSHANQIARKRGVVKEVVVTEVILTDKKDPSKTETLHKIYIDEVMRKKDEEASQRRTWRSFEMDSTGRIVEVISQDNLSAQQRQRDTQTSRLEALKKRNLQS